MFYSTLTQKGQITLPKKIREMLNLSKYDTVAISTTTSEDKVILTKAPDILDMAGTLKVDPKLVKKYPVEKVRELMEKEYGKLERTSGRF